MATYRDGNVRKATPNSVTAAKRSAKNRQCPECSRKSALVRFSDDVGFGVTCRWKAEGKCSYESFTPRLTNEQWLANLSPVEPGDSPAKK